MKIAVIGSRVLGMNELIYGRLQSLNDTMSIELLTQSDASIDKYDGIICLSTYDLEAFELMIGVNEYSRCNMLITGAVMRHGDTFGLNQKQSDYNKTILWRDKLKYQEALSEFLSIIS